MKMVDNYLLKKFVSVESVCRSGGGSAQSSETSLLLENNIIIYLAPDECTQTIEHWEGEGGGEERWTLI